ncbi:MAG TPA: diacylglycerol kinase family protein [Candidatus Angelobacter sp.]|nr:diacylglycerol kinase family protein [Candidatus Angelobacter sp.]
MRSAALLHPTVSSNAVQPFHYIAADLEICAELKGDHLDAALIFGGDGTVHRHLPELSRRRIPFLVVPKGSGNDFAKSLGIGSEAVALTAWKYFRESGGKNVAEIDLGIIRSGTGEIPFCCVAGTGLDSMANALANRMPSWLRGSSGYFLAALRSVVGFVPTELTATAAERRISRPGLLVAVGNAHRYGHGMKIAPRADLSDGLLDVCFVGSMNRLKLLCCVPTIFFGTHLAIKQVEYFQSPAVRIESGRPLEVYADGEYACTTPVEIGVVTRGLRVIVPQR